MRPISNGSIIGIPMPKQWWVGDGPIEPRLFIHKDTLYITFNGAMGFSHKIQMDFTIMWNYDQNVALIPKIKGGSPMVNATEKNDMPRDKVYISFIRGFAKLNKLQTSKLKLDRTHPTHPPPSKLFLETHQ